MIPLAPSSISTARRFCPKCGVPTQNGRCMTCDPRAEGATFCPRCGTPAADPASSCSACEARAAAPPPRPIRSGLGPILYALVLYFGLLAVLIVGPAFAPEGRNHFESVVLSDMTGSALLAGLTLLAALLNIRELWPILRRTGRCVWYLAAPFIALATYITATAAVMLLDKLLPSEPASYSDPYLLAGFPWWAPFVATAVMPGIFEELAFRGVITGRLSRVLRRRETIVVCALLFATLHLTVFGFAHLLITGLALGLVRDRSGSLYPGMLIHFCHNSYVVYSELLAGGAA